MEIEKDLKDYILISKNEFEKLIEIRTKYNQYKNYVLSNTQNNNLVKTMVAIEGKNLYQLIDEKHKEGQQRWGFQY